MGKLKNKSEWHGDLLALTKVQIAVVHLLYLHYVSHVTVAAENTPFIASYNCSQFNFLFVLNSFMHSLSCQLKNECSPPANATLHSAEFLSGVSLLITVVVNPS